MEGKKKHERRVSTARKFASTNIRKKIFQKWFPLIIITYPKARIKIIADWYKSRFGHTGNKIL